VPPDHRHEPGRLLRGGPEDAEPAAGVQGGRAGRARGPGLCRNQIFNPTSM
jgi:hypothetical protein